MKILSWGSTLNMKEKQASVKAKILACFRGVARGSRAACGFLLAAGCLLFALAALQVLFIGGTNTLGVAPQISFLWLNITLIAFFSFFAFPSLRLNLRRTRQRKLGSPEAAKASDRPYGICASVRSRPVCKVLVIRRLAKERAIRPRVGRRTFDERGRSHEATFNG